MIFFFLLRQYFVHACFRYRDAPGNALRCTYEGTLRDLLIYYKPRGPKKLYYQVISIPIDQLENKRQFKCVWVANQLKEERELALFPNKDGTVSDLLNEAREQVDLQPDGTGKLRLLEIISSKVFNIVSNDVPLEHLISQAQRTFRIEVSLFRTLTRTRTTTTTTTTTTITNNNNNNNNNDNNRYTRYVGGRSVSNKSLVIMVEPSCSKLVQCFLIMACS